MTQKLKWLKQYLKKCHLTQKLDPLAPLLAIVLLIAGFVIALRSLTLFTYLGSKGSYLGSIILAIYSLKFCYCYGNYELVQVVDWSIIGVDFVLLFLAVANSLGWHSNNINDLVVVLLLISAASNVMGTHYKGKRHLY